MESGHEVIITLFATIQLHLKFSTSLGDPGRLWRSLVNAHLTLIVIALSRHLTFLLSLARTAQVCGRD